MTAGLPCFYWSEQKGIRCIARQWNQSKARRDRILDPSNSMTSRSLSTTRNRIFMSVEETSTGHGVVFAAVTTEILMARIRIVMITACLFIARPFHPSLSFFDRTNSTIFRSFFPVIFKHFFFSLLVTVLVDPEGIILLEMSTFFPLVLKRSFRFSLLAIYIYFYM